MRSSYPTAADIVQRTPLIRQLARISSSSLTRTFARGLLKQLSPGELKQALADALG
jgi:hypothetical protein